MVYNGFIAKLGLCVLFERFEAMLCELKNVGAGVTLSYEIVLVNEILSPIMAFRRVIMILSWILARHSGIAIGLYCLIELRFPVLKIGMIFILWLHMSSRVSGESQPDRLLWTRRC